MGAFILLVAMSSHLMSRREGGVWPTWLNLLAGGWIVAMELLAGAVDRTRLDVLLGLAVMLTAIVSMVEHRHYLRLLRRGSPEGLATPKNRNSQTGIREA